MTIIIFYFHQSADHTYSPTRLNQKFSGRIEIANTEINQASFRPQLNSKHKCESGKKTICLTILNLS